MAKSFFGGSSKTSTSNKKTKSKSTKSKNEKLNKFVDKGILGTQNKSK